MKTGTIPYNRSAIFFRQFGTGSKKLFCFHGYGETSETFIFLEDFLGEDFTLIAFDFPFHGQTQWNNGLIFTTEDLISIINHFLEESELFYLLGFSMGGRIALHLLENIPQKIKQVALIAPDGLHKNFWYCFATQNFIGNKLFAYTMKNPAWFFGILKLIGSLKLINKSIFNFAHQYLDDKENRILLYERWTTFRKIKPNLYHLKKIIQQNNVQVNMLFGKFDRIILSKNGKTFSQGIENKLSVTEIEAGHQLLRAKYANEIVKLFNS